MYKPVDVKRSFPKMEEEILRFWQDKQIFSRSLSQRQGCDEFVFYDGPPFATGLPHFGHFVPGTVKDIFPRYKTMRGYKVERRFGWDCHGLPVEYEMEKELKISGKKEIEKYGVARFNEACRSIVLRYTREWRAIITRLGRWVDFDNDYKTMETDYMESIWWVFKRLWDKGLIYEGFYILPYCPRCSTAISNHELNLGGYREVVDPAITTRFRLLGKERTYFLAWTTTPWTLPSNLALTLGANIDYVKIKDKDDYYILAEARLPAYYKAPSEYQVIWKKPGSQLTGLSYEPLFPYFADLATQGAFKTFTADYVSTQDGTGIVHTAPGFGEDDYNTLRKTAIPTVCPVDAECCFTDEVPDYIGRFVKDADKQIIADLKKAGKLVRRDNYPHSYPHCWRCSSPLIYRAISSWFVNIGRVKEKMLAANDQINWEPNHLKDGRFGKWLANARDWAISRNRFWGNPLPIWKCDACQKNVCVGSQEELASLSGQKVEDLHKHFVDQITLPCECGKPMRRIPEVLDCWFESGAMPYAQNHYPFENRRHFESNFPADFICEGLDQTRGWFYTLVVLGAALFDKPPFKNVIVNGLVLAADGKKMSKSARNYSDPEAIINRYGADGLRLFLMNSAVVRGEDLRFTDNGVRDVVRGVLIPLWNAYAFFVTYANIDQQRPDKITDKISNPLDQWILSETQRLIALVREKLDGYEIQKALEPLLAFIDNLNNWYIRRSRRRFWRSDNDPDKSQAYQTLRSVLMALIKVAAPFIPFVAESVFQNLRSDNDPASVHLCDYPEADESLRDPWLEKKMAVTQAAVSLGRSLRASHNLKVRQPLKAMHLVTRDTEAEAVLREMKSIIEEELNVKKVVFRKNEEDLVEFRAKANFRVLGKKLGPNMKAAAALIAEIGSSDIRSLTEGEVLRFDLEFGCLELNRESVVIERYEKENLKVINQGTLTVALDTELTPALQREGMVRDLVRQIQNLRKEKGLEVSDRIRLWLHGNPKTEQAVKEYSAYIESETLAAQCRWQNQPNSVEVECGEEKVWVRIEKAQAAEPY